MVGQRQAHVASPEDAHGRGHERQGEGGVDHPPADEEVGDPTERGGYEEGRPQEATREPAAGGVARDDRDVALVGAQREALPAIQIELVVSNQVSNLLQREADIALRMVQPAQASLVAKRIAEVSLSACASTAYLARRGRPAQPPDLLQHELIGYDQQDDLLRGFAAMGFPVTREHFALRTDDLIAAWEAVRAGLGVGFAADYTIDTDPAVQRLLPMLPLPRLPIWLTVHREIRNSGRIRAVYDFLAQAIPLAL